MQANRQRETADPLVLVPGLDGTGLLFYRQVPLLETHYEVETHRLRDDAATLADLVEGLDARIARLAASGRRVTLVGESFGGALSLCYALAHPDRVERLVIINSFPHFGPQARLWLGYHLLRATPWGVMRIVRQLTARRLHSAHTGREEIERFHQLMRATTRAGYLSRLHMLRTYDVRERLAQLTVPVLYVAADGDHLVPAVEQARLMASLTPRASVRVLAGHGHICLIAPGVDLARILDEWTPPA
ncbi:MAG: alpha/beta fold hydrolase [Vicinamibacterales bacterium]